MKTFFKHLTRQQLALFLCCLLMVSLVYSPFLLSVSMIGLVIINVFNLKVSPKVSLSIHPDLKNGFQCFLNDKSFLVITTFFFIVFFSGVFTEDFNYWLERLRLKIPFLVLPFAFASLPTFSRRQYRGLFYFLLILLTVTCVGIGINYALNFEEIITNIKRGQPVPTPRNHIRFSLLLALGIIAGVYLSVEKFYWKKEWEHGLIKGMTAFLFIFIHILSVRSGLLVLYLSIVFLTTRYIYSTRRYGVGFGLMLLLSILPMIAYQTIPSFKGKIDYAFWDFKMYQAGKGQEYSDANRLISLEVGLKIGHANPILGVGAGNLKQAVKKVYSTDYPQAKKQIMPHNQFLSVYAGMGIVGLFLFLGAFFFPLFYKNNYRQPIFLAFHVIVFFSFMMENTIENAMGIAFYTFFLCLGLNVAKHRKKV